jgi:LPXTG-site transpeptidase (sortase) family protein
MTLLALLIIPAIGIREPVFVPRYADPASIQRCICTNVCKYPQFNVLAAHDYQQFSRLRDLRPGDMIHLGRGGKYSVTGVQVVGMYDTDVLQVPDGSIRLQTCLEDMRKRLIVTAREVSKKKRGDP